MGLLEELNRQFSQLDEQMDIYDDVANMEFGMDYDQLGSNEKEWVRDEIDNMPMNEKTDFIDDTEAGMDFEDLPDQDIDNDGDTDQSDEYLHNRLGTIAKMDEAASERFLRSAGYNLARQMRGKSASRTTLKNRLYSMPLGNRLKPDDLEKVIDYAMKEMGLSESVVTEATGQQRLNHLRKFGIAPDNQPQSGAYIKSVSKPGKFFVDWKDAFKLGDVVLEFVKSVGSISEFDIIDLKTMKRTGKQLDVKKGQLGNLRTTYGVRVNESVVTEASKERMVKQIERALKDGVSIFKLPMATQDYYRKNKDSFELNESDINDPVLTAFRAAKMKREKELAKPTRKPLYGKQRMEAEDRLWNISQDLKDLYSDRGQLLIDMEQEAEVEGGPIADRYGADLDRIESEIQKLIAQRNKLEMRLAEGEENEIDEANVTANLDGGAGPMRTPKAFGRKEDERGSAEKLGMKKSQKSNRHFRKMESKSQYKTMMAEMYGVGKVNESVSYREYKKDPKASPQQKVNKGIAEINSMLAEIERMVQNNVRLKQEMGVNSSHFWKATGKRFAKINERMTRISNRLRELSK